VKKASSPRTFAAHLVQSISGFQGAGEHLELLLQRQLAIGSV
jgi:hypothetical protein